MGRVEYKQKGDGGLEPEWQLQEAKACFSEVVRRAQDRPQRVTLRGKDAVVVVSADYFERMLPESGADLTALMVASPLGDLEFGDRGKVMPVREVEL